MSFQADKAIYKPLNNIHVTDKKNTTVGHLEEILAAANTLTLLIPQ